MKEIEKLPDDLIVLPAERGVRLMKDKINELVDFANSFICAGNAINEYEQLMKIESAKWGEAVKKAVIDGSFVFNKIDDEKEI